MSQGGNLFDERCPSRKLLQVIGDRWTLLVVAQLERGTRRNSELLREIGGISPKVLSTTLRQLEELGLVARTVHPEIPPRVEYALTDLGLSLSRLIIALDHWVEAHAAELTLAQETYWKRPRGPNPWQVPETVQTLRRASSRVPGRIPR